MLRCGSGACAVLMPSCSSHTLSRQPGWGKRNARSLLCLTCSDLRGHLSSDWLRKSRWLHRRRRGRAPVIEKVLYTDYNYSKVLWPDPAIAGPMSDGRRWGAEFDVCGTNWRHWLNGTSSKNMPENIRALAVIAALAVAVFWGAGRALAGTHTSPEDFRRRRNLWLAVTFVAFLSPNYWLFIIVSAALVTFGRSKEENSLAMFFGLAFVVPQIAGSIPGFGLINYFFEIDIVRLLSFLVLLPAYLMLQRRPETPALGSLLPDKLLLGFIAIMFALRLQETTVTDALRFGMLYPFLEMLLPYYVASRACLNMKRYGDAVFTFVVATLLLAAIAVFEYSKKWLLYKTLGASLAGAEVWSYGYLGRGEALRAVASAGQPIPLGVALIIGIAFLLYVRSRTENTKLWGVALLLLCMGLFATVSRGPWIAAIVMVFAFVGTSPNPFSSSFKTAMVASVLLVGVLLSPLGPKLIDLIPFVGDVDPQNAEYRKEFLQQSIPVIIENPFFGTSDYVNAPQFDDLKPQGLLDTLNVFITVALSSGLVGLLLYAGVFLCALFGVFRAMRRVRYVDEDLHLAGRSLFAALVGLFVAINTVSTITIISLLYWSMCGLGIGYVLLANRVLAGHEAGNSSLTVSPALASVRREVPQPRGTMRARSRSK